MAASGANGLISTPDSAITTLTFFRFPIVRKQNHCFARGSRGGIWAPASVGLLFPLTLQRDRTRPAVVIFNSAVTDCPKSSKAQSSAQTALPPCGPRRAWLQGDKKETALGISGSGLINFETTRFILHACPAVMSLLIFRCP